MTNDESTAVGPAPVATVEHLTKLFGETLSRLERASTFAKSTAVNPVLEVAFRLFTHPKGVAVLYDEIERIERAGTFDGTDWAHPETLQPRLAAGTLEHGTPELVAIEMLSELRMLAVARGDMFHLNISSETAQHFLAQVLALEVDQLFGSSSEASRESGSRATAVQNHLSFIAEGIGYGHVLDSLVAEIERILAQRPIQVDNVVLMITRVAAYLSEPEVTASGPTLGVSRLVAALYGPTGGSREDPGIDTYTERLATMDESALWQEAREFALAMHSTGLVSPHHAAFLHHVNGEREDLVGAALGLSRTGTEALSCYGPLITRLIEVGITPTTFQSIYPLAQMIESGVLFDPAIAPSLWGQIGLVPSSTTSAALAPLAGDGSVSALLLAGVINVLGQPLGIGQGNNPTCQAARAISMWAMASPDYLIRLVTRAARDDEINIFFEGQRLSSAELADGSISTALTDVDPVSMVLVPHLDRVYIEMGRRCADRGGDPHTWINRELHGWWVGRETAIAVDVATGTLVDVDTFVRRFYALYHPIHNGNRPVVHPQPAGVAVTDSLGRFIGWHAISVLRVGLDPSETMRVYFFNPNNDSGQDWGHDVVVSTEGNGERFGESSLPIDQFASRLYLYHYDPCDLGRLDTVDAEEMERVEAMARASWAADR